jgi:hypothetical protein
MEFMRVFFFLQKWNGMDGRALTGACYNKSSIRCGVLLLRPVAFDLREQDRYTLPRSTDCGGLQAECLDRSESHIYCWRREDKRIWPRR